MEHKPMKFWHIFVSMSLGALILAASFAPYLPDVQIRYRKIGQDQGFAIATEAMQKDAIKHHYARYDTKTGAWRWNTADETWGELSVDALPESSPTITTDDTNVFPVEPLPAKKSTTKPKK